MPTSILRTAHGPGTYHMVQVCSLRSFLKSLLKLQPLCMLFSPSKWSWFQFHRKNRSHNPLSTPWTALHPSYKFSRFLEDQPSSRADNPWPAIYISLSYPFVDPTQRPSLLLPYLPSLFLPPLTTFPQPQNLLRVFHHKTKLNTTRL